MPKVRGGVFVEDVLANCVGHAGRRRWRPVPIRIDGWDRLLVTQLRRHLRERWKLVQFGSWGWLGGRLAVHP